MAVKKAMLEAYEQSESNKLVAIVKLNEHLDVCLDSDCCARCDNLRWRVRHYDTELEILLEDIKAL